MTQTKVCIDRRDGSFSIRREDRDAARYWTGPDDNKFVKESENDLIIWSTENRYLARHLRRKIEKEIIKKNELTTHKRSRKDLGI